MNEIFGILIVAFLILLGLNSLSGSNITICSNNEVPADSTGSICGRTIGQ